VTTLLIPIAEFQAGGKASGRALIRGSPLSGQWFGTIYDLSTIAILWFAGASAAGLLNIVPRYLPRYGMAPTGTGNAASSGLYGNCLCLTILFKADVGLKAELIAGVLVLMSSAAFAVTLLPRRSKRGTLAFGIITLVFLYTTIVNIIERPEGIRIAAFFIGAIIVTSVSRVWRSTEIRADKLKWMKLPSLYC